ncbi:MAG: riboflavin biosynthesis protein RibD [Stappia sp.]|nr:riboflavin biosynthesis protein RibD [Stappia sp.]MBM22484.1 riboflavin biosynthesis protein RibD [Stappia sp.]
MAAAAAYARRGLGKVWPNPAVGAIIVRDDGDGPRVVGRGNTQPPGGPHAEVVALRQAADLARGATCYVTLEPCSHQGRTGPCAVALAEAGVKRVVIGLLDPNPRVAGRGVSMLEAGGVEVCVASGEAARLAAELHAGHVRRVTDGRPHVILKLAVSRDGYIGRPGNGQVLITGEDVFRRVHVLRAECDGILVGIGTVLEDDPSLSCRLPGLTHRSPVRVVLDTEARLPLSSTLVKTAESIPVWVVVGADADPERLEALTAAGCMLIRLARPEGQRLDPHAVMRALGQRGLTRLLVEGGAGVARSLMDADLADEICISRGDVEIGDGGLRPFVDRDLSLVADLGRHELGFAFPAGRDTMMRYVRKRS